VLLHQVLVVLDFGTLSLNPNISGASTLATKARFAGVCVVRIEYLGDASVSTGDLSVATTTPKDRTSIFRQRNLYRFFDYLIEKELSPNDFFLIRHVFHAIVAHLAPHFQQIHFWTDNEAKAFKSRFVQTMLSELQQQYADRGVRLRHCTWAPYHAQSMADSHIGRIRDTMREQQHSWEAAIKASARSTSPNVPSLQHSFASFDEVKDVIERGVSNTEVVLNPKVERDKELKPSVKAFSSIQNMHVFEYAPTQVLMRQHCNDAHVRKETIQYELKRK
jgi:hypothetical protein